VATLARITAKLETKETTLARLRRILFGAPSERTAEVLGAGKEDERPSADTPTDPSAEGGDESAAAMIGLLKYGCGLPFDRIERLERGLALPLPAGTQWTVVSGAAPSLMPVFAELVRQAAQGSVLYNDDTAMRVLVNGGQKPPKSGAAENSGTQIACPEPGQGRAPARRTNPLTRRRDGYAGAWL